MGRLIDADELLTRIRLNYNNHQNVSAGAIKDIIDTTRTAYDVERVVEELERLMVKTISKMVESKETPEWFYEVKIGEYINKKEIINIIRKGGIE